MAIARQRRIPEWKVQEVNELAELIRKYPVIIIADLMKVPTSRLQRMKRKIREMLGDRVVMRVAKNTLFRIAMKKVGLDPTPLEKYLTGTNMFIFTDMNPFELAMVLDKIRVTAPAKPGMTVESEVVIPAGDTGLKPGPIMSVFGKLKIPIRVQKGTIWIAKDTVVAKPGDTISMELASLLQKLGIEPIVVKLKLKAAYDRGVVIPGSELLLDLDKYRDELSKAVKEALWLGVEIGYPEPDVIKLALPLAARRAVMLAAEAGFVTPETAEYVLGLALARAMAVVAALGDKAKELGIEVKVQRVEQAREAEAREEGKEEKKEEEEEKREEGLSEEQLAAGLESLFGA
jgi:large subunit ribosomal protein L10